MCSFYVYYNLINHTFRLRRKALYSVKSASRSEACAIVKGSESEGPSRGGFSGAGAGSGIVWELVESPRTSITQRESNC